MSKPFFSIIIPTLNEAKYLPHLLTDLSNQTFQNYEVIIADGHSEDKTVTKAKEYSSVLPSLKIINSEKRHVCVQRNLGAQHAQADWLIFMDADNRLPSYFLQGARYRLESSPCHIASFWIEPDKHTPSSDLMSICTNLGVEIQNNIKPRFLLESLIMIDKYSFVKINGFDESTHYAEGVNLITQANKHSLIIKFFRDPIYYFSFRRFRKFGTLKMLKNTSQLGIGTLINKEYKNIKAKELYPMLGGNILSTPNRTKNRFLKNIQKLLQNL